MADVVQIIIEAIDEASGVIGNVAGELGTMSEIAGGVLAAAGVAQLVSKLGDLMSEGLNLAVSYERLDVALTNLNSREIVAAGGASTLADAMGEASRKAEEQLNWAQGLAETTPFTFENIANTMRMGEAMGMTSGQSQRMTQDIIDAGVATGATNEQMQGLAREFGSIAELGDLQQRELRRLSVSGILPLDQALDALQSRIGVTREELMKMIKSGSIPAGVALNAFTEVMEKNFSGAAERAKNTLPSITNAIKQIGEIDMMTMAEHLFKPLEGAMGDFRDMLSGPQVKDAAAKLGDAIGSGLLGAVTIIRGAAGEIASVIRTIVSTIQSNMGSLGPAFTANLANIIGNIRTVISGIISSIQPVIVGAIGLIIQAITQVGPALVSGLAQVGAAISGALVAILPAIEAISGEITGVLFPVLSQMISFVAGTLVPALANAFTGLVNIIGPIISAVAQIIATAFNSISSHSHEIMAVLSLLGSVLGLLGQALGAIAGKVLEFAGHLADAASKMLGFKSAGDLISSVFQAIATAAGQMGTLVVAAVEVAVRALIELAQAAINVLHSIGVGTGEMQTALDGMKAGFSSFVSSLHDGTNQLQNFSTATTTAAAGAWDFATALHQAGLSADDSTGKISGLREQHQMTLNTLKESVSPNTFDSLGTSIDTASQKADQFNKKMEELVSKALAPTKVTAEDNLRNDLAQKEAKIQAQLNDDIGPATRRRLQSQLGDIEKQREALGPYIDKWDEFRRRAEDVAQHGVDPAKYGAQFAAGLKWAEEQTKEGAKQIAEDFKDYSLFAKIDVGAAMAHGLINMDAVKVDVQHQIDEIVGKFRLMRTVVQQTLAGMTAGQKADLAEAMGIKGADAGQLTSAITGMVTGTGAAGTAAAAAAQPLTQMGDAVSSMSKNMPTTAQFAGASTGIKQLGDSARVANPDISLLSGYVQAIKIALDGIASLAMSKVPQGLDALAKKAQEVGPVIGNVVSSFFQPFLDTLNKINGALQTMLGLLDQLKDKMKDVGAADLGQLQSHSPSPFEQTLTSIVGLLNQVNSSGGMPKLVEHFTGMKDVNPPMSDIQKYLEKLSPSTLEKYSGEIKEYVSQMNEKLPKAVHAAAGAAADAANAAVGPKSSTMPWFPKLVQKLGEMTPEQLQKVADQMGVKTGGGGGGGGGKASKSEGDQEIVDVLRQILDVLERATHLSPNVTVVNPGTGVNRIMANANMRATMGEGTI